MGNEERNTATEDAALRDRLAVLAKEHSQSELARRTGVSQQNVNRYLKGVRVPASFCSSLAKNLEVNPVWLLTGEGAPTLGEVPAETVDTTKNLLSIVKAMDSIARMRLGSLVGKDHLKAIRELDETLRGFERTREKLASQTRPLFAHMIEDVEKAINARDYPRAKELSQAAAQMARLCPDKELMWELDHFNAIVESLLGNAQRSIELHKQVVLGYQATGKPLNDEFSIAVHNYVMALDSIGRVEESARQTRSALSLLDEAAAAAPPAQALQAFLAVTDMETGRLAEGIQKLTGAMPALPAIYRDRNTWMWFYRMQFFAGVAGYADAARYGPVTKQKSLYLLLLALWLGDR